MELQNIIEDLQNCLTICQSKLNLLKTLKTGKLYEVDVLFTRKEAANFINKTPRQLDRLCTEQKIKREYIDGAIRIRKSSLLIYMGMEVKPVSNKRSSKSEFERILEKYC